MATATGSATCRSLRLNGNLRAGRLALSRGVRNGRTVAARAMVRRMCLTQRTLPKCADWSDRTRVPQWRQRVSHAQVRDGPTTGRGTCQQQNRFLLGFAWWGWVALSRQRFAANAEGGSHRRRHRYGFEALRPAARRARSTCAPSSDGAPAGGASLGCWCRSGVGASGGCDVPDPPLACSISSSRLRRSSNS